MMLDSACVGRLGVFYSMHLPYFALLRAARCAYQWAFQEMPPQNLAPAKFSQPQHSVQPYVCLQARPDQKCFNASTTDGLPAAISDIF